MGFSLIAKSYANSGVIILNFFRYLKLNSISSLSRILKWVQNDVGLVFIDRLIDKQRSTEQKFSDVLLIAIGVRTMEYAKWVGSATKFKTFTSYPASLTERRLYAKVMN